MTTLRQYKTSSGKTVLLGKSAETNEELIEQAEKNEYLLHTKAPGSPFANIKALSSEVDKKDLEEAAIMCAKHSQDWRDNKKDISVHYFLANDVSKSKDMKTGTFGVGKCKNILVKKQDILEFEKVINNQPYK
jgi:predicted ribosome quality control (RQC) complex YloA/Tae2 family protein